jgi:beta-galactosidase
MEQTHGAILNSWGTPSVGFDNVEEAGRIKDLLEKAFKDTEPVKAELAVTYSDRARAFFMSEPLDALSSNYMNMMQNWYRMILDTGIHRDFIYENSSFDGYKLLMTPFMPYIPQEYMDRAVSFAENGGIWIVGPLTGIRTGEHTINTDYALGRLEEMAGVRTVYHYPVTGSGITGNAFGIKAPLTLWSSIFECIGAKAAGMTEDGATPGMPFITEYPRGKGKIVMLGSMPSGEQGVEMLRRLVAHYAGEAGITRAVKGQPGTLVVPRKGKDFVQWVVINIDGKGGEVTIPVPYKDAFSGRQEEAGKFNIGPYDCKVIEIYKDL